MRLKGSIVIASSGRRFVMVRHNQRAWEFPGGHIEGRETPLEAAKRELREETGFVGRNWRDCGVAELDNGNLALFACDVKGRPNPETEEISEARFFTAPPMGLSFARHEYFLLLEMAGHRPKMKTDYDLASKSFDNIRGTEPGSLDIWLESVLRYARIDRDSKVLDIGCGTGRYSMEINTRTGASTLGVDFSRGMLECAHAKKKGIWLQGDALHLPVLDGIFDSAIMMLMLQHVDDEPAAISEAWRVLKPGGRLVIATVSHSRIRRHIMRHFPGLVKIDLDRFMPVPELKWHLTKVGFGGVRSHRVSNGPTQAPVKGVIERFRQRYISTLALVPAGDFEKNMALFEKRLKNIYGDKVEMEVEMTFIEARKP